jgi:DNA-binding NarL/FixJ family response regulator
VLELISQGASNKQISAALHISQTTVRSHVRSLMQKLDLENRTQLAVYGVRKAGFRLAKED